MTTASHDKLRVAVLMGGQSSEHDVSISSGLKVLEALDRCRYEVVPVTIDRSGAWLIDHEPKRLDLEVARGAGPELPAPRDPSGTGRSPSAAGGRVPGAEPGAVGSLRTQHGIDVVFVALHGPFGEDGTVQGLLTLAGLPFTGSGVLASALAMDKVKAKEIYAFHGLPVARQLVVHRHAFEAAGAAGREAVAREAVAAVGLPCVVKPVAGGSSVGAGIVRREQELVGSLLAALALDQRALVEELLAGTEVTCGVLGGGAFEPSVALPVTEIVPKDSVFFDYRAKYTAEACSEITPARISDDLARRVQDLAVRAHDALGCEGMSRSDFIIRDGMPVILETNTIPGLTDMSLLPQAAAHAGIPFPKLLDGLIDSALLRAKATRSR